MSDEAILSGDTYAALDQIFSSLNRRRKDLGLSHRQLAAKSGVSMATIARVLGGYTRNAHIDHIVKLCLALELSITLLPLCHATDLRHQRARLKATALVKNKAKELGRLSHPEREHLIEVLMISMLKGPSGKLWE